MIELNKIYNEDCLEGMKRIPDKSVDMILCDLPYGTTACKWDTIIPFDPLWEQYERVIKDNGAIVLTASQPFTSSLVMSNPDKFRYSIVWEKEQGVNFLSAKKQPMKVHEDILVFYDDIATIKGKSLEFKTLRDYFNSEKEKSGLTTKEFNEVLGNYMSSHYFTNGIQWTLPTEENYSKLQSTGFFKKSYDELKNIYDSIENKIGGLRYFPQMKNGKPYISGKGDSGEVTGKVEKIQTKNKGTRYPRSVVQFKRETGLHPTQKPVALFEYLIKTYTNYGETVLDNCIGSGTTAIACLNTNRNFIGFEMGKEYFEIAQNRIKERQNEISLLDVETLEVI